MSTKVKPNPKLAIVDASQGPGHANHTHGNGAEFAQDPLSLPSGPITRLRAKRFKEALNGLIQGNGVDSKKTKMAFQSFVVLVFIWLGDGSRLNKSCLHDLGVPYHHCYRVSSPLLVEFISIVTLSVFVVWELVT
jgi:hypothetical protein